MQKSNFVWPPFLKHYFPSFVVVFFSSYATHAALCSYWKPHPFFYLYLIQDSISPWLHCLRSLWQENRKLINAALSPSLHLEVMVPVRLQPGRSFGTPASLGTPHAAVPCSVPTGYCQCVVSLCQGTLVACGLDGPMGAFLSEVKSGLHTERRKMEQQKLEQGCFCNLFCLLYNFHVDRESWCLFEVLFLGVHMRFTGVT